MYIKKFNESDDYSDFDTLRKGVLNKIDSLIREYEDLTNEVSPNNWRTTGHHLSELRKMKEDIVRFKEISEQEKEIDWVKQSRLGKINLYKNV